MTDEFADRTEQWGGRSSVKLEELPRADPIAFLGTERHPLSAPPTTHDVEPPIHDDVLPRSRWVRRAVAAALGALLVFPMVASFSSDEVPAPTPTGATQAPPVEPAQPASLAIPQDLPPGGLSERAAYSRAMSEERSVADWTDAMQPRDGSGVATSGTGTRAEESSADEEPSMSLDREQGEARKVSAPRATISASRRPSFRPGVPTTLDFEAAMRAVSTLDLGPDQCGPEAIGAVPVEVTFAPSGRAVQARVESGPLSETPTGRCIALELRKVRIAPFDGPTARVRTAVLLK